MDIMDAAMEEWVEYDSLLLFPIKMLFQVTGVPMSMKTHSGRKEKQM